MQVIQESRDRLIVHSPATGVRVAGGAAGVIGILFIAVGFTSEIGPLGYVGAGMLVLGALMALLPSVVTFSFDRRADRMTVARRRVWERDVVRYEEYKLSDVDAVRTEASTDSDGSTTWRVVVRLANGIAIPFTSYYTSGRGDKDEVAEQVGRFIKGTPAVETGVSSSSLVQPQRVRPKRGLASGLLCAAFGAIFATIGGTLLAREAYRLSTWLPVQATVLHTRIARHSNDNGYTYSPVVQYRYTVRGRDYVSDHTLPVNESRGGRWADRVVERFTPGEQYTAWFDPKNPTNAFIVRSRSVVAPIFTGVGGVVFVLGIGMTVSRRRRA